MAGARSVLRLLLPVVLVALPGLLIASEVAAAAKQRGQSSARLYRLRVQFTGKSTYAAYDNTGAQWLASDGVTTYSASTKRPFHIRLSRRGACRRAGCLRFRAKLSGALAHHAKGWQLECWVAVGSPGQRQCSNYPAPDRPERRQSCFQNHSEWATGRVTGSADYVGPPALVSVGIIDEHELLAGDATESNDCGARDTVHYFPGATYVTTAPSKVWTEPAVDVRRRFKLGRRFEIEYAPGALPDKPNRVELLPGSTSPAATETYDFRWTLRFTPSGSRKRR